MKDIEKNFILNCILSCHNCIKTIKQQHQNAFGFSATKTQKVVYRNIKTLLREKFIYSRLIDDKVQYFFCNGIERKDGNWVKLGGMMKIKKNNIKPNDTLYVDNKCIVVESVLIDKHQTIVVVGYDKTTKERLQKKYDRTFNHLIDADRK